MTKQRKQIPLGKLKLYPAGGLNRKTKPKWAKELEDGLDTGVMPPLAVIKNGTGYWVSDGQHRYLAMKGCGLPATFKVDCEVYDCPTTQDEAWVISILNNFKDPGIGNKFRWKVEQGDEEAQAIAYIALKSGWGIAALHSEGRINAIKPLQELYRTNVLTITLRVLADAYLDRKPAIRNEAVKAALLQGVGLWFRHNDKDLKRVARLVKKLRANDPEVWLSTARSNTRIVGVKTLGVGMYLAICQEMKEAPNHGALL